MPRITMNACSFIQLCLSQLRVSCCMFLPRNLKVSGSRLCGEIERRTVYRRFLQEKTIHSNKHAAKWLKMICLKHFWADSTSSCLQLSCSSRGPSYTCIYWSRSCELVSQCNYPLNPRIHSVHLETELNSSGLQVCLLHDLHFLAKLLAGNRFQAFRLKGSSSPAHLHYWSTG